MRPLKKLTLILCIFLLAFPRPAEAGFRDWLPTWLGGTTHANEQSSPVAHTPKKKKHKKRSKKARRKQHRKYLKRQSQKNNPSQKIIQAQPTPQSSIPSTQSSSRSWRTPLINVTQMGLAMGTIMLLPSVAAQDSTPTCPTCPTCSTDLVPAVDTVVKVAATAIATVTLNNWAKVWGNIIYTGQTLVDCVRNNCCCCFGRKKINYLKNMFSDDIPDGVLGMIVGIAEIAQHFAVNTEAHYDERWVQFNLKTATVTFKGLPEGQGLPPEIGDSPQALIKKGVLPFTMAHDFWLRKTPDQKALELAIIKALAEQRLLSNKRKNTHEQQELAAEFFRKIGEWYQEKQIILQVNIIPEDLKTPQRLLTVLEVCTWEACGVRTVAQLVIDDAAPNVDRLRLAHQLIELQRDVEASSPRSIATTAISETQQPLLRRARAGGSGAGVGDDEDD